MVIGTLLGSIRLSASLRLFSFRIHSRPDSGAIIVESSIVLGVLLMLLSGTVYYGMVIQDNGTLAESVRVGGRAASLVQSRDPATFCSVAFNSTAAFLEKNNISHYTLSAKVIDEAISTVDDQGVVIPQTFYGLHLSASILASQRVGLIVQPVSSTFDGFFRIELKTTQPVDFDCGAHVK